jgi:membrane protein
LVFAVLLVFVLLLTLGAVVFGQVILNTLDTWFTDLFQMNMWVISSSIRYLITFVLLGLLFSLIYAAAPNLKLRFKDVYIGAYLSAFVWILGSAVFAYYINHFSHYGLLFGSLGGIFILLAWLYFTSLVLLIGIYFNATLYYRKHK